MYINLYIINMMWHFHKNYESAEFVETRNIHFVLSILK